MEKNYYIVSYDMAEGGRDDELIKRLKDFGAWARITKSIWALFTSDSAKEVRDALAESLPEENRLFVVRSGVASAWRNVRCSNGWLQNNL